jgi:hypothetical protein
VNVSLVSGSKAKDIKVETNLSSTIASRLTLDSYHSISVIRPVTVVGSGALTLTTNDGGTGGTLSFTAPGRVAFWDLGSSLVVNGVGYTLVGDIATLGSDIASNPSGHYALANNYDASVDGTYASSPIPSTFTGAFEGLGNIISNLSIHASHGHTHIGLFAFIGTGGMVEDIGLTNVSVRAGYSSPVGALAAANYGSVVNAYSRGFVRGGNDTNVGGLIGLNTGYVAWSHTSGNVIGGNLFVGGLIGDGANITRSYSTARVFGTTDAKVGGLVGELVGSLSESWTSGAVTVGDDDGTDGPPASAGGLICYFFSYWPDSGVFRNCYATGTVTGGANTNVGGLIGTLLANGRTLINLSYSTGQVVTGAAKYAGGPVGYVDDDTFVDSYWDTDTSGITDLSDAVGNVPNKPGITGLTDAQLKSGLPSGFDPSIWAENPSINGGYPYLIANPPP